MNAGETCHLFRPEEQCRHAGRLPAELFRLYRRTWRRGEAARVFVPVRGMQVLAVLGDDEIIFVDSFDYRVQDGIGGRLIQLAWRFASATAMESLNQPVPCTVIHYQAGLDAVQRRLLGEFRAALCCMERRTMSGGEARVLPFTGTTRR